MIRGRVNRSLQIVVPILVGREGSRSTSIEAVVDTGFTGSIALPSRQISELRLTFHSVSDARLADGSIVPLRRFSAFIIWMGVERGVLVLEAEGGPLLGMHLLAGCDVHARVVEGADVVIRP